MISLKLRKPLKYREASCSSGRPFRSIHFIATSTPVLLLTPFLTTENAPSPNCQERERGRSDEHQGGLGESLPHRQVYLSSSTLLDLFQYQHHQVHFL